MGGKPKLLYILYISELGLSKIGISENVQKRLKQLQTGCPYAIDIVRSYDSPMSSRIERIMHRKYRSRKADENECPLSGEWFNLPVSDVLDFEKNCREIEDNINYLKSQGNPFVN